jgi:hypothetical protein
MSSFCFELNIAIFSTIFCLNLSFIFYSICSKLSMNHDAAILL